MRIANARLVPAHRPDHVVQPVRPAHDGRAAHELVLSSLRLQKGLPVIERAPLQAVLAVGQVKAVLPVPFEVGKEKVCAFALLRQRRVRKQGQRQEQSTEKGKSKYHRVSAGRGIAKTFAAKRSAGFANHFSSFSCRPAIVRMISSSTAWASGSMKMSVG